MGQKRYKEAFKIEVVRQITEAGHRVYDVANRLGISNKSLYDWINEVTPSRTAQVKVQMTGGHHERRSTRQTLDSQAQVSVGY